MGPPVVIPTLWDDVPVIVEKTSFPRWKRVSCIWDFSTSLGYAISRGSMSFTGISPASGALSPFLCAAYIQEI